MITYKKGSLMDVTHGHIIHGCNAQGVMGGGVALQVKKKYPLCFAKYATEFITGGLALGTSVEYRVNHNLCIWNAITQEFYGNDPHTVYVDYQAVAKCFQDIANKIFLYDLMDQFTADVHLPFLGAGLANGDWVIIESLIASAFINRNVTVWSIDGKMPDGADIK